MRQKVNGVLHWIRKNALMMATVSLLLILFVMIVVNIKTVNGRIESMKVFQEEVINVNFRTRNEKLAIVEQDLRLLKDRMSRMDESYVIYRSDVRELLDRVEALDRRVGALIERYDNE